MHPRTCSASEAFQLLPAAAGWPCRHAELVWHLPESRQCLRALASDGAELWAAGSTTCLSATHVYTQAPKPMPHSRSHDTQATTKL